MYASPPCVSLQGYGNSRFVFQGVHETICYGPSDKPWADNEPRINQIVFIGRKLDRKALMEGFRWVFGLAQTASLLLLGWCWGGSASSRGSCAVL
jgi:hypothetical protein